ncbi:AtpZ/AtpI family protein [Methylocystis sp. JAN1]|uniref:AtpZ/AtpI family protein n=1 Tax=Methylocystis sp. JAN1 TaxID=3397211 RepID=UPI003FA1B6C9
MTGRPASRSTERLSEAARKAAARERELRHDPEPSLGKRLGQIGVLGWTIVLPALAGLFAGRWLDRTMHSGVFFSAPLVMAGAALGLWLAWKWMSRQ